jgi:hypothetical protein
VWGIAVRIAFDCRSNLTSLICHIPVISVRLHTGLRIIANVSSSCELFPRVGLHSVEFAGYNLTKRPFSICWGMDNVEDMYDTFPYPSHSQPFVNEYGLRLASNWDTIAPWSRFGAAETFATIIDVIKNEVDIAAALDWGDRRAGLAAGVVRGDQQTGKQNCPGNSAIRLSIMSELAESGPSAASTCHPHSWRGRAFSTIAAKRIRFDC